MATLLKQSTAVDIAMGPFLDETDGRTAETALTITQPDIRLKKNGGNWAQKSASQTLSHEENGWYEVALSSTDTDTPGILIVAIHESGALPVWREFMVVPANVYDSLVGGSDLLQVDVTQVEGSDATNQIRDAVVDDATRIDASALNTLSGHDPGEAIMGATDLGTGAGLTSLASAVALTTVDNVVDAIKVTTDKLDDTLEDDSGTFRFTQNALEEAPGGSGPTAAAIADAVWDEALSGHLGGGSTGEALDAASSSSLAGPGALERTIGITAAGNPIEGASVWVATDEAGSNVIAGPLTTDSNGEVTVLLDAGSFYLWMQKDGFAPLLAEEIEIS